MTRYIVSLAFLGLAVTRIVKHQWKLCVYKFNIESDSKSSSMNVRELLKYSRMKIIDEPASLFSPYAHCSRKIVRFISGGTANAIKNEYKAIPWRTPRKQIQREERLDTIWSSVSGLLGAETFIRGACKELSAGSVNTRSIGNSNFVPLKSSRQLGTSINWEVNARLRDLPFLESLNGSMARRAAWPAVFKGISRRHRRSGAFRNAADTVP